MALQIFWYVLSVFRTLFHNVLSSLVFSSFSSLSGASGASDASGDKYHSSLPFSNSLATSACSAVLASFTVLVSSRFWILVCTGVAIISPRVIPSIIPAASSNTKSVWHLFLWPLSCLPFNRSDIIS
ncbi:hypothetical protein BJ878DRAFT_15563 [Calycina marina]|uniref:Uncharacterized protein n=1 Tax=Calycina marina TaxID=1763456 RepID=A0A9P8CAF7_9HELO|nr:hypothetical protein BJ878DRAFT_15563 [Calycina marina]